MSDTAGYVVDGLQYARWGRPIFEELREGGVSAVHVTIAYWEGCRETLAEIGRWHRRFEDNADLITPVTDAEDVEQARAEGRTGIVFGFQNCSPIEDDIDLVHIFHQLGVRFMQLSYNNQSLLATGCSEREDPGITRFGREVIREMNRVGMVVDMSHSAERSTLEAIELSERPIAITHANPAFWAPSARNKSEAVLRALAESGGMLGLSLYPNHLKGGSQCRLEDFCEMVGRTVALMGVERVGVGSDLCQGHDDRVVAWMRNGRWRKPSEGEEPARWPAPLPWFKSNCDFACIASGLREHGFAIEEVGKIMGANWLRFFRESFGPR